MFRRFLHRRKIIRQIKEILNLIRDDLPQTDWENANILLLHGEWGLALDTICEQLYEFSIPINRETNDKIEASANQMNLEKSEWGFVSELIK